MNFFSAKRALQSLIFKVRAQLGQKALGDLTCACTCDDADRVSKRRFVATLASARARNPRRALRKLSRGMRTVR
jgi:hypothetical protein